ncbi:MAG: hypothetical protein A2017_06090 [Lentisphaerae bacterium GWF2_44_16]|nr:MAG: hypothetical protein A2017_06090 [Lentisphaerae bacterium GWF2_44_16]
MKNNNMLNTDGMKRANRFLVLDTLHRAGPMSRSDLTRNLKCDGTTITNIIRDLFKEGLVISGGVAEQTCSGRPKELIDLNQESRHVIGLSFDPPFIAGIISDLRGNIKFCDRIMVNAAISSERLSTLIKKVADSLMARTDRNKLLGIGITTFGVLSSRERKLLFSGAFPALCRISIDNIFNREFNIRPEIIDGTHAKAMAELYFRRKQLPSGGSFMLIEAGTGTAYVNVLNGTPVLSSDGFIGEFGHTIVIKGGKKCYCGRRGCLETVSSLPSIMKEASIKTKSKNITFEYLLNRYEKNDSVISEIINTAAESLGEATGNLFTLMPTDELIITGKLTEFGEKYMRNFKKGFMKTAFPIFVRDIVINRSSRQDETAALGACSLLIRNFLQGNGSEIKF